MHTDYTLTLDDTWDVVLDGAGNMALSVNDAAVAQNVANSCRLFTGDAYFDTDRGIPWFTIQLGRSILGNVTSTYLRATAEKVSGVKEVTGVTLNFDDYDPTVRALPGEITFTTERGAYVAVEL